jgi:hypothetical protein
MFRPLLGHHQGDNRYKKRIKDLYISLLDNAARAYAKHQHIICSLDNISYCDYSSEYTVLSTAFPPSD